MMKFLIPLLVTTLVACEGYRSDRAFWTALARNELVEALSVQQNLNSAKNVILFIGDGMDINTVTATRIYKGGESHRLVFEEFPSMGLLKTYNANKMVPDSSSAATALFSGVKTNQVVVGVDATVPEADCQASLSADSHLKSLAADALNAGKSAGLVTTMRVTHSTPAPLYAHCPDRRWECEARMPVGSEQCKDLARQLVEDWPGRDMQVILGGGRQMLVSDAQGSTADPLDAWGCRRQDGRNLNKQSRGLRHSVVSNNADLRSVNYDQTDYLFGIFANGHLKYEYERDQGPEGMPSIAEMTEAAIDVLRKNDNGYFLMVEGGNIDMSHHRSRAKVAIDEAAAFEDAVRLAATMTSQEDTLIIVAADHGITLTFNGFPERGGDLFGIAGTSANDGIPYTTLFYGTGGPGSMQYFADPTSGQVRRVDPSTQDTDDFTYEQGAGIILDETNHGGGDVAVYARGPYAHLFHNVHEQHYLYHAVTFAAKIGDYYGS